MLAIDDSGRTGQLIAQAATVTGGGTLQKLSFYVAVANGNLRLALYDATGGGGKPGTLRAQTASFVPVLGWNTVPVINPTAVAAGDYYLAFLVSSNTLGMKMASTGPLSHKVGNSFNNGFPSKFPAGTTTLINHWSFYGTLVP